ncbi:hypothetical protein DFH07DRAFT_1065407, partial [Mycena maculata]
MSNTTQQDPVRIKEEDIGVPYSDDHQLSRGIRNSPNLTKEIIVKEEDTEVSFSPEDWGNGSSTIDDRDRDPSRDNAADPDPPNNYLMSAQSPADRLNNLNAPHIKDEDDEREYGRASVGASDRGRDGAHEARAAFNSLTADEATDRDSTVESASAIDNTEQVVRLDEPLSDQAAERDKTSRPTEAVHPGELIEADEVVDEVFTVGVKDGSEPEENFHYSEADKVASELNVPPDAIKDDGQENVTLIVKDINRKDIPVSLPAERCRLWETFRNRLVEQQVQPLQYIEADQFVLVVLLNEREDTESDQVVSKEDWEEWISFCASTLPPPIVAIRIIRPGDGPCCERPTEIENSLRCASCKTQFVNLSSDDFSLLDLESPRTPENLAVDFPVIASPANPTVLSPTTPVTSPPTEALTTSFQFTPKNSVVRRRKPSSTEYEGHVYSLVRVASPEPNPDRDDDRRRSTGRSQYKSSSLVDCLCTPYTFMIAPPFLFLEEVTWDSEGQRLENRLNAFQNWIWGANSALLAFVAALLSLSDVASSPGAHSFVMLSGIFAFFGFVYTVFLAFHGG